MIRIGWQWFVYLFVSDSISIMSETKTKNGKKNRSVGLLREKPYMAMEHVKQNATAKKYPFWLIAYCGLCAYVERPQVHMYLVW